MAEPSARKPVTRACAICGKPAVPEFSPFCSARCQDIDLNRWLSDAYRVPTSEEPEAPPEHSREDED
jgi:endogenous inhibitor of DNA gyrase (YacG/DUF329 family)